MGPVPSSELQFFVLWRVGLLADRRIGRPLDTQGRDNAQIRVSRVSLSRRNETQTQSRTKMVRLIGFQMGELHCFQWPLYEVRASHPLKQLNTLEVGNPGCVLQWLAWKHADLFVFVQQGTRERVASGLSRAVQLKGQLGRLMT